MHNSFMDGHHGCLTYPSGEQQVLVYKLQQFPLPVSFYFLFFRVQQLQFEIAETLAQMKELQLQAEHDKDM